MGEASERGTAMGMGANSFAIRRGSVMGFASLYPSCGVALCSLVPIKENPGTGPGFSVVRGRGQSTALTMSSMTFLASPKTIMVLSR